MTTQRGLPVSQQPLRSSYPPVGCSGWLERVSSFVYFIQQFGISKIGESVSDSTSENRGASVVNVGAVYTDLLVVQIQTIGRAENFSKLA